MQRQSVGYSTQPSTHGIVPGDDRGLAGQEEEGGLEDVFDVVIIAEDPPADLLHQRAMALDQGAEGSLLPALDKTLQQDCIAHALGHRSNPSPGRSFLTYLIMPGSAPTKCKNPCPWSLVLRPWLADAG